MHEHKLLLRYLGEMAAAFILYAVILILVHQFGFPMHDGLFRTLVLLSPIVPVLLVVAAVVRYFQRVDEYLRLIFLENWAVTGALTAVWTFTYGFFENVGWPRLSMFTIFPIMGVISALLFVIRRMTGR